MSMTLVGSGPHDNQRISWSSERNELEIDKTSESWMECDMERVVATKVMGE